MVELRVDPGRRKRFESEVLPHLDALHRTALRLTRSQADADDLVQDSVLKAYRFFDHYEAGTNIRAWLLRLLTNVFFSKYRRQTLDSQLKTLGQGDPVADGWMGAATMAPNREPERLAEKAILEGSVMRAVEELPEEFRAVLLLADVEGLTYREIAESMGCPIGTIMSRLHRARRAVATKLGVTHTSNQAPKDEASPVVNMNDFRLRQKKEVAG
ncbi:MAG: sigma-70 family RNA polymerase sigma factor [Deltaproteobacteria bacterium]|nr:sigma-70 family RNA polymerase sigma factor [Deltaproteobacteria bacterium]